MNENTIQEQVDLIREVFIYAHRFKEAVFVLHLDYSVIEDVVFPQMVKDLVLLKQAGIRVVLVPGASGWIDQILGRYGIESPRIHGIRISRPEAIPFIKMAAFDVSNRLLTLLSAHGVNAVIGNWVRARSMGVQDGVDYMDTGVVERIKTDLVRKLLNDDLVPIFPCIGWSAVGKPYNISSLEIASSVACALGADKLFFLAESNGINTREYDLPEEFERESDGRIPRMDLQEAGRFLEITVNRMEDKTRKLVQHGYDAAAHGVKRVHIIGGKIEGVLLKEIFSNLGIGTMIHTNVYQSIRSMKPDDVGDVFRLMQPYIRKKILIPRTEEQLHEHLQDYVVWETDGAIHGCGALHRFGSDQAEIAGIAVDPRYDQIGIGRKIVEYLIEIARTAGLRRVFVLTTQTADWFQAHGFSPASVNLIPKERQAVYDRERNSRVLVYDL
jgi:amino-acid N-acetyltransferase